MSSWAAGGQDCESPARGRITRLAGDAHAAPAAMHAAPARRGTAPGTRHLGARAAAAKRKAMSLSLVPSACRVTRRPPRRHARLRRARPTFEEALRSRRRRTAGVRARRSNLENKSYFKHTQLARSETLSLTLALSMHMTTHTLEPRARQRLSCSFSKSDPRSIYCTTLPLLPSFILEACFSRGAIWRPCCS